MRTLLAITLLLCLTCPKGISAEEQSIPQHTQANSPPDPLELEKGWWEYFDVPENEISHKINAFQNQLKTLTTSLDKEKHKEILEVIRQTTTTFEILEKKKKQQTPSEPNPLQLLTSYTLKNLYKIHEDLLQTQSESTQFQEQMESRKGILYRIQSQLDKAILDYHGLPRSSYQKLLAGLKIIDLKAKLAIQQTDVKYLDRAIKHLTKKKKLLNDELIHAKEKISFENTSQSQLQGEWETAKKEAETANAKYTDLERLSYEVKKEELQSELVCCLWDYQAFTQRIRVEELNLESILQYLELVLWEVSHENIVPEANSLQKLLGEWNKSLLEIRQNLLHWQKTLDEEHASISKIITKSIKEQKNIFSEESIIKEVHLELDKSYALLQDLRANLLKAELLQNMIEKRYVEKRSLAETWSITAKLYWNAYMEKVGEIANVPVFHVKDHPITLGVLVKALLIFLLGLFISIGLRRILVKNKIVVRAFSKSTEYIVLRFIHYSIVLLSLLIVLGYLGLNFTNLAIVAGALGVGIGFGLQSMVNNMVTGFTLLLNKYLKVGDIIEIEPGLLGKVIAINLQNTQIEAFDGANIIIPNAHLGGQKLTNWTMYTTCRRFRIPFRVAYGTDKDFVRNIVVEAVKKLPFVMSGKQYFPNPEIWFIEYGQNSFNFELVAWVDLSIGTLHGTAHSSILWEIDNVLKEHDIQVPVPERNIYVKHLNVDDAE